MVGDVGPAGQYGGSMPRGWLLPRRPRAATRRSPSISRCRIAGRRARGLDVAPELSPAGTTPPWVERNRLLNEQGGWFGLIALSQVGMTFLAVYFWDRRRRAYLWFAIQALTASYYPAYILGLPALAFGWTPQNLLLALVSPWRRSSRSISRTSSSGCPPPHRAWLSPWSPRC